MEIVRADAVTHLKGTTYLDHPLVLTPADSGRVFEGAPGAVLSGGVRLGPWTDLGRGVWEADAPRHADGSVMYVDQLWVNGRRAVCARLPNEGHFRMPKGGASIRAVSNGVGKVEKYIETATLTNEAVAALADVSPAALKDVQMRLIHCWSSAIRTLASFDRATRTVTCESKQAWTRWQKWDARTLVWFENVPSAFDAPGEWLFDRAKGKVRYRPLAGETMANAEVIVPRRGLTSLVEFRGDPSKGEYVTNVVFRNVTFAHAAAPDDANGPHRKYQYQAAFWAAGAVQAEGACGCTFENCRFVHTGGYGLRFDSGCVSNRIVGCLFEDVGAGGVWMGEKIAANDTARRAGIVRKVLRPTAPTATAFNLVSNCVVRNAGRYDPEGVGVCLGHCSDTKVVHNDIHDIYYSGVSVGWTWGFTGSVAQRNEIAFNRIWDLGKGVLSDMGGVYMLGTAFGSHVHDNVIHDVRSHAYGGWALYLDEGSEGVTMERNLCWNTTDGGFHQHYGTGCVVRNNIFLFNRELGAVRMYRDEVQAIPCTLHFLNNIIVVDRGPFCGRGVRRVGGVWANNVWWDLRGEAAAEFDGLKWRAWQTCGKESNGVFADPRFTDLKGGDYTLRADSPAIKLGFKPWDFRAAGASLDVPQPKSSEPVRLAPMGRILVPAADVRLVPTTFYPGWISRTPYGGYRPEADGSRRWRISEKWQYGAANNGTNLVGRTFAARAADGSLDVTVTAETAATNFTQIGSCLVANLPNVRYAGGKVILDGTREKTIPAAYKKGKVGIFREKATQLAIVDKDGRETLALRFPRPTACYLQDNREWKNESDFSIRISFDGKGQQKVLTRGDTFGLSFNLKTPTPIDYSPGAYTVREGADWVRVKASTEPTPGSALDFSNQGLHDAPAGKHGWLVVRDGHFEFEKLPGVKQRFYGVNFVGEANYPPAKDADRYVANLARIGYNAVRFHHHDNGLADRFGNLRPEMMARFDAMVAACIKYGVYMTTDLYVSRRIRYADIGIDKPGVMELGAFKVLVETHEGAYSNFLAYARNFLNHVNPHTGRRYADEPAMPLYSLINEGNNAKRLTVENERTFARRMTKFVREEMKSRILLTNMNNYAYPEPFDDVRANEYDYIDGHFYCDHPHFLENKWQLPSELANINPLRRAKHGLCWPLSYRRRIAKAMPFVITEYNFSGPGAYRGLGGIETGAMAAYEDLDGLWRFAWSHGIKGVYGPKAMTYFDMSGDPLSLAGERASLCLFLRGDLKPGDAAGFAVDEETGALRVATARTCGGFAETGTIRAGALTAEVREAAATVWASSLDAKPLAASDRILCCHLTDVQNSGITYADDSRKVLLDWGKMPHLMRKGRASVSLALGSGAWKLYALDCAGNRRSEVPFVCSDDHFTFEANVSRDGSDATMFYELVRKN